MAKIWRGGGRKIKNPHFFNAPYKWPKFGARSGRSFLARQKLG